MRVEILAVGTEMLLGQIVNTNASTIAARLADHAVHVPANRIVIAGGDGTIAAALPALLDVGKPLAVIPLGTAKSRLHRTTQALPGSPEPDWTRSTAAHEAVARLEGRKPTTVVTQNVDDLHERDQLLRLVRERSWMGEGAAELHDLVTLGPLTNIAAAIKKDKTAMATVKRIVLMGLGISKGISIKSR